MDKFFMYMALEEAKAGLKEGEVPIGAVVVEKNKVIARAHNRKEGLKDPTAHAEILAIREAAEVENDWRLSGVTLYVTVEPCIMCVGAIIEARISRVVFGAFNEEKGAVVSRVDLLRNDEWMPYRIEVKGGVLQRECEAVLERFFNMVRNGGRDGRVD